MTMTRANTEFVLVSGLSPMLTAAGMSTDVDGTNVNLNNPIGHSIRDLGHTVASVVLVSDADVAQVTDAQTDQYLDVANLYTLEAILGNLDDVDIRVGPLSESLSKLAEQLERKVKRMRSVLDARYGFALSAIGTGYVQVDIAEHD